ncbi:hypothetical protein [Phragmitibacter flavus]|nr:hypothetical protein [Phragmitibacter flavus]
MMRRFGLIWILTLVWGAVQMPSVHAVVLVQQTSGQFAFEAESYTTLTGTGWERITTTTGTKTLPGGSNAVGDALYSRNGGSPSSFATYSLQFIADGTYYVYSRYSMYDIVSGAPSPPGYGNEDSFHIARDLGLAPAIGGGADVDWYAQHLSPQGHLPADSPTPNPNDGRFFYWDEAQLSGTSTNPLTFTITGASATTPVDVTFSIGNREGGVTLDRFVFSTTRLNTSISAGNSATLDGIASVPEPSRAVFSMVALVLAVGIRRRDV